MFDQLYNPKRRLLKRGLSVLKNNAGTALLSIVFIRSLETAVESMPALVRSGYYQGQSENNLTQPGKIVTITALIKRTGSNIISLIWIKI